MRCVHRLYEAVRRRRLHGTVRRRDVRRWRAVRAGSLRRARRSVLAARRASLRRSAWLRAVVQFGGQRVRWLLDHYVVRIIVKRHDWQHRRHEHDRRIVVDGHEHRDFEQRSNVVMADPVDKRFLTFDPDESLAEVLASMRRLAERDCDLRYDEYADRIEAAIARGSEQAKILDKRPSAERTERASTDIDHADALLPSTPPPGCSPGNWSGTCVFQNATLTLNEAWYRYRNGDLQRPYGQWKPFVPAPTELWRSAGEGRARLVGSDDASLYFVYPEHDRGELVGYCVMIDNLSAHPNMNAAMRSAERHLAKVRAGTTARPASSAEGSNRVPTDIDRAEVLLRSMWCGHSSQGHVGICEVIEEVLVAIGRPWTPKPASSEQVEPFVDRGYDGRVDDEEALAREIEMRPDVKAMRDALLHVKPTIARLATLAYALSPHDLCVLADAGTAIIERALEEAHQRDENRCPYCDKLCSRCHPDADPPKDEGAPMGGVFYTARPGSLTDPAPTDWVRGSGRSVTDGTVTLALADPDTLSIDGYVADETGNVSIPLFAIDALREIAKNEEGGHRECLVCDAPAPADALILKGHHWLCPDHRPIGGTRTER